MPGFSFLRSIFDRSPRVSPAVETQDTSLELLRSLLAMAWFVEARDPYTGGHLWRVSRFSRLVAERAGMDERWAARAMVGGFLHDLGKIGVPDAILRKPDRLTDDEYEVIKTHPDLGARLLSGHPMAELVVDAVRLHHERPDGLGYPLGLQLDRIPKISAIVSVCDAFDAMTSHRPYRAGMPEAKALEIIKSEMGRQFHSVYAQALLDLGQAGELRHVIGHSEQGIPLYRCTQCGPTLVLTAKSKEQDRIFCRNCASEYIVVEQAGGLGVEPTGHMGQPFDLLPELDIGQIEATLSGAQASLSLLL